MFTIEKDFAFSADHALEGLPPEHQCSRFHGHNYIVRVRLGSETLVGPGFIRDYNELDEFKKWLDESFDHRWLGYGTIARVEVDPFVPNHLLNVSQVTPPALDFNPTAENMAEYVLTKAYTMYPEVIAVGVSETPKTWAWCET